MTTAESSWFTALYQEFYPRVLAYAMRRASPDAAREAADETFLVAWRRREAVPADGVLPWLLVVARNTLSDQRRRGRRQDALAAAVGTATADLTDSGADAAVVERMTVLNALARLPASDREVLFLNVWDGLGNQDAARVAGCSAPTFAVRLSRARRRLAAALDQLDREPGNAASPAPRPPTRPSVSISKEHRG